MNSSLEDLLVKTHQTIESYRTTNYTFCDTSRFGYFDSSEFLAFYSHAMSLVLIPICVFGYYCILFKTPVKMKRVKWMMLNLHLWTGLVDIMLTSLITPYLFFPAMCGYPLGIFTAFGMSTKLQVFMGQASLGGLAVSVAMMFENRQSSIVTGRFKLKSGKVRIIFFGLQYIYGIGFLLPAFLNAPDQDYAKYVQLAEKLPCPTPEFFEGPVYVLALNHRWVSYPIGIFVVFIVTEGMFFLIHSFVHLFSHTNMSARTKQLQKKFLIGVCFQVAITTSILLIPIFYFFATILSSYYNQTINNFGVLFLSLHGMSATVVLIAFNEPYRAFTRSIFCRYRLADKKLKNLFGGKTFISIAGEKSQILY